MKDDYIYETFFDLIEHGVTNLFLTMHPFSIPTNVHVPLQHFNRQGGNPSEF